MSNLYGRDEVRSTFYGLIAVHCKVTFGASGAVSASASGTGTPVVATETDTGRYTFTFAEKYNALMSYNAAHDYQGTPTAGSWQTYAGYDSAAGTVVLSHEVSGSEADPASGNVVDFIFWMKKGSA